MLIIFGGLPATGKTTLSRALARHLDAVHVRIDSIEQAILKSRTAPSSIEDMGYLVGYALAEDNLRLGRIVVADSVNPLEITRDAWRTVAARTGVNAIEFEIICSNANTHKQRVESRLSDITDHKLPSWEDVIACEFHPWSSAPIVVDTAHDSVDQSLTEICTALPNT